MWSMTTFLCVAGTLLVYAFVRHLYLRYKHPLINVVGLSAAVIISTLLLCRVPYAAYEPAKNIMTGLIGAATVSLALPLYRYRAAAPGVMPGAILASVGAGAFTAMLSAGLSPSTAACRGKWSCPFCPRGSPFPLPWKWPPL